MTPRTSTSSARVPSCLLVPISPLPSVALVSLGLLLASGSAKADYPIADTFEDTPHEIESDASMTVICNGYVYCMFGALKTGASTEETFFCPFDAEDYELMALWGTDESDDLFLPLAQNGEFDLEEPSVALIGRVVRGRRRGRDARLPPRQHRLQGRAQGRRRRRSIRRPCR